MTDAKNMSMSELLEMYPEFKPAWKACGDNKNLRYHVRKAILEHHEYELIHKQGKERFGSECKHEHTRNGRCLKCFRKVISRM